VYGNGSGSYPVASFDIGSAESYYRIWIFGKFVARMVGGWNWLRIMSNCVL